MLRLINRYLNIEETGTECINMTTNLLGLELEVESCKLDRIRLSCLDLTKCGTCGEPVQLDLALGEEPVGCGGGGLPGGERDGRGEDSLGQQTSQVSGLQHGVLGAGVVGVDEGRLGESVVVVFILVLLGLPDLVGNLSLGRGLASAGNVISVKNSEILVVVLTRKCYYEILRRYIAWRTRSGGEPCPNVNDSSVQLFLDLGSHLNPLTPALYLTTMVFPFSSM